MGRVSGWDVHMFRIYALYRSDDPFTNSEVWNKDFEGNRRGLIASRVPAVTWRDWRKSWELRPDCRCVNRGSNKAPLECASTATVRSDRTSGKTAVVQGLRSQRLSLGFAVPVGSSYRYCGIFSLWNRYTGIQKQTFFLINSADRCDDVRKRQVITRIHVLSPTFITIINIQTNWLTCRYCENKKHTAGAANCGHTACPNSTTSWET